MSNTLMTDIPTTGSFDGDDDGFGDDSFGFGDDGFENAVEPVLTARRMRSFLTPSGNPVGLSRSDRRDVAHAMLVILSDTEDGRARLDRHLLELARLGRLPAFLSEAMPHTLHRQILRKGLFDDYGVPRLDGQQLAWLALCGPGLVLLAKQIRKRQPAAWLPEPMDPEPMEAADADETPASLPTPEQWLDRLFAETDDEPEDESDGESDEAGAQSNRRDRSDQSVPRSWAVAASESTASQIGPEMERSCVVKLAFGGTQEAEFELTSYSGGETIKVKYVGGPDLVWVPSAAVRDAVGEPVSGPFRPQQTKRLPMPSETVDGRAFLRERLMLESS